MVKSVGSRLKRTVLARLFLQVEVYVAVVVARHLVVYGRISHAQLFAYACHKVGGLLSPCVRQGLFKVRKGRTVVADGRVARCESALRTGCLIHIAVCFEKIKRVFCHPSCHETVAHVRCDGLQRCAESRSESLALLVYEQMFGHGFERVCHKECVAALLGHDEAFKQQGKLLPIDVFLRTLRDYASGSYIIYIVEILRSVVAYGGAGSHVIERIGRLPLQSHVIIICGVDYRVFRFGIVQPSFLSLGQFVALLVYAPAAPVGTLAVVIKVLVARHSLAEAHLLHLGYEQFNVVVGVG